MAKYDFPSRGAIVGPLQSRIVNVWNVLFYKKECWMSFGSINSVKFSCPALGIGCCQMQNKQK